MSSPKKDANFNLKAILAVLVSIFVCQMLFIAYIGYDRFFQKTEPASAEEIALKNKYEALFAAKAQGKDITVFRPSPLDIAKTQKAIEENTPPPKANSHYKTFDPKEFDSAYYDVATPSIGPLLHTIPVKADFEDSIVYLNDIQHSITPDYKIVFYGNDNKPAAMASINKIDGKRAFFEFDDIKSHNLIAEGLLSQDADIILSESASVKRAPKSAILTERISIQAVGEQDEPRTKTQNYLYTVRAKRDEGGNIIAPPEGVIFEDTATKVILNSESLIANPDNYYFPLPNSIHTRDLVILNPIDSMNAQEPVIKAKIAYLEGDNSPLKTQVWLNNTIRKQTLRMAMAKQALESCSLAQAAAAQDALISGDEDSNGGAPSNCGSSSNTGGSGGCGANAALELADDILDKTSSTSGQSEEVKIDAYKLLGIEKLKPAPALESSPAP